MDPGFATSGLNDLQRSFKVPAFYDTHKASLILPCVSKICIFFLHPRVTLCVCVCVLIGGNTYYRILYLAIYLEKKSFSAVLCLSFPPRCFIINWLKKINWNSHSPSHSHWSPFFLISPSTQFFDLWAGGWAVNHLETVFCGFPQWEKKSFGYCGYHRGRIHSCSLGGSRCHVLYICNWRTQLNFKHEPKMEKLVFKGQMYYLTRMALLAARLIYWRNIWK